MRSLALFCVALALGCATEPELATNDAPIVRGSAEDQLRGVVAVVNLTDSTFCSGVLVTPRVVLTARHCVSAIVAGPSIECTRTSFGELAEPDRVVVATTRNSAVPDGMHVVARIVTPRDSGFCGRDLAALILSQPLEEDEARPITLRDRPAIAGETFAAIGFGRDGDTPSGARRRRDGLRVTCVGKNCKSTLLAPSEWWGDGAVCEGDSGGPALDADGLVVGIASRKRSGCSATIYTDVSTARGLVAEALGEASRTPEGQETSASCRTGARGDAWWLPVLLLLAVYARGSSRPTIAPPPSRFRA